MGLNLGYRKSAPVFAVCCKIKDTSVSYWLNRHLQLLCQHYRRRYQDWFVVDFIHFFSRYYGGVIKQYRFLLVFIANMMVFQIFCMKIKHDIFPLYNHFSRKYPIPYMDINTNIYKEVFFGKKNGCFKCINFLMYYINKRNY